MSHQYNESIAKHYFAFRPALHEDILLRLIKANEHFRVGLDIGCGTGYSTVALSKYCDRIFGLDLNQSMLDKATIHPKISYIIGYGDDLHAVEKSQIDVVSFAGSLFYTKTQRLKNELLRVLTPGAVILVYDFQIILDDLMVSLDLKNNLKVSDYNHSESFDGWSDFTTEIVGTDSIILQLSPAEAAHILLASSDYYGEFQIKFQKTDPFECLKNYLILQGEELELQAKIYFARYCVL